MNQSQITSLMAAVPVPLQQLPPTHVLPCLCVVVLQFVAAKQLKSRTLLLQMMELLRLYASLFYPSTNSRVIRSKQNQESVGFMFPGGCAPVFLYLYRRDKICKMSKMLSANIRKRALGSGRCSVPTVEEPRLVPFSAVADIHADAGDDGLGISCFILEGVTVLMSALFWA